MIKSIECSYCEDGTYEAVCISCNGTGEGLHETQKCLSCKGSGIQKIECDCCQGEKIIELWNKVYKDKRKCVECGKVSHCLIIDIESTANTKSFEGSIPEISICKKCISRIMEV